MASYSDRLCIFNPSNCDQWMIYKDILLEHFTLNNITDDGIKRLLFLNMCNQSALKLLEEICTPAKPECVPYNKLVELLDEYFTSSRAFFPQRDLFYSATKNEDESIQDWAERVKLQGEKCEFRREFEMITRDRFICGFPRGPIKDRLFQEHHDLTFVKALEIATSVEENRDSEGTMDHLKPDGSAGNSNGMNRQLRAASPTPSEGEPIFVWCDTCGKEHPMPCRYTYEAIVDTANFLKRRVSIAPIVGIICGSGMGSLADALDDKVEFPYELIPHFPRSTVKGHVGKLVFGHLSGVPVVCMKGRFHYYEGYPLWKCAMPVRVMKLLGVTHLIATNAAGGLNSNFKVGDIMLVKDHINLMGFAGNNPLQGPNDERFGPRFPPMNTAYSRELIVEAKKIAKDLGLGDIIHEGVYTCLGGPNFETVAELKMLSMLGADTVGMSTVHEVITARHCDLTVFAFSLITNMCITDLENGDNPNHEEVIDVGKARESVLKSFVQNVVKFISQNTNE